MKRLLLIIAAVTVGLVPQLAFSGEENLRDAFNAVRVYGMQRSFGIGISEAKAALALSQTGDTGGRAPNCLMNKRDSVPVTPVNLNKTLDSDRAGTAVRGAN